MLGGETVATGFLGRGSSHIILDCLSDLEIRNDFIIIEGETRVNTKVAEANGRVTELNEAGPVVSQGQMKQLLDKLISYAGNDSLFVFAGNVPRGVSRDIYATMIKAVKEKGSKVFLDAEGELFQYGVEAIPDMIKPNHIELAQYFGCDYEPGEAELMEYGKKLQEKGIRLVAISRGKQGALFLTGEKVVSCRGLSVKALSTVGAGDAMVAALCHAIQSGMSDLEAFRLCMAVASGAVMTQGTKPPGIELVEELKERIELTILEDL
jgi:1-phosphofructokinase